MIWFGVFYCLWLPLMLKKQISAAAKSPVAKSQFLGISGALQPLAQVLPGKNFPGKAGFKPFPGQPRSELQVRVCCGSKQGIPADPWECGGWAGAGLCLELPRIWTLCQAAVPSSHSQSRVSPAGPLSPHRPLVFLQLADEKQQNAQRDGKISFYINIAIKQGFILSP